MEPTTIVLVGMRGAGKTTLGSAAAELLGWQFADLDEIIAGSSGGKLPPQIVEERGWDAFRQVELDALREVLGHPGSAVPAAGSAPALNAAGAAAVPRRVVACGGGIVETQQGLTMLEQHWPVVMIDAPWEDVLHRLQQTAEAHRADLGEELRDVYARRLPRYRRCANVRFSVARCQSELSDLARSLARLFLRLAGEAGSVHLGPETFALALTLPDCTKVDPRFLSELSLGADVLELRVDLLASAEPDFIAQQVAVLRQHTLGAPLLFTVRSADHGGRFSGPEQEYLDLLKLGLALGVEMLDVESTWTQAGIDEIVEKRGRTLLVGSHYDTVQLMPEREEIHACFKACMLRGIASVARVVVRGGKSREQNLLVQHMGSAAVPAGAAFVGLCAGREGRLSCLLNRVLCPATHQALVPAETGLLTIQELMQCRRTLSILSPGRQFPVIAPWGECRPPPRLLAAALRGAFLGGGKGHTSREERLEGPAEVRRLLSLASLGGALVQGELRREVAEMMHRLGDEATRVGAVDCVVQAEDGSLCGESSQCIAICKRLEAVGLQEEAGSRVGLVLGGGVAMRAALAALKALGFGRILRATTRSALQEVQDLPAFTVVLDKSDGQPFGVDISHNNGPSLRVEAVKGGLVQAWNAEHPDVQVVAGDWIIAVNGVSGDSSKILAECSRDQMLQVRVVREAVASLADDPVEDLTILASLPSLDVILLADLPEEGCSRIKGAQWVTSAMGRLRPVVLETAWPPRSVATPCSGTDLLEAARNTNCSIIEGAEVLLEQVCACILKWTGDDSQRRRAAKVLLEEVSKVQSEPALLVDVAAAA